MLSAFKTGFEFRPTYCCQSRRSPKRSGTFVNAEGRMQSFVGVVKPQGETRPGLEGAARAGQRCWGCRASPSNRPLSSAAAPSARTVPVPAEACCRAWTTAARRLQRPARRLPAWSAIADVPIYASDALVAPGDLATSSQRIRARRRLPAADTRLWSQLGLTDGDQVNRRRRASRSCRRARKPPCPPMWSTCRPACPMLSATLDGLFVALTIAKV
jgi:NADH-quinone oxidoreductase subunit G